MRSPYAYVIVFVAIIALFATADARPKVSIGVDGVKMLGHTAYIVPELRESDYFERELEFPFNPFMARLNIGVEGAFSGGTPWRFLLDVSKNVNDPGSPMKDTGWMGSGEERERTEKYLYIESDAELKALVIDLSGRLVFHRRPRFRLEGILGYSYRKMSYEMFGQHGWVWDPSNEGDYFEGEKVIEYDITYHIPYVGIGSRIDLSQSWAINAELSYSPRTMAKHDEDYLVRNRASEADCTGKTIISGLGVTWAPGRGGEGLNWFVGAGADLTYTTTEGDEVQSWYGDDWETEGDDSGNREPSIDTEIKSTSGSIQIRAGITM